MASLYERNSLDDIITHTTKMAFTPLTVGGGLRTIEDITIVLRAGADNYIFIFKDWIDYYGRYRKQTKKTRCY